jgi:hypothetical protein
MSAMTRIAARVLKVQVFNDELSFGSFLFDIVLLVIELSIRAEYMTIILEPHNLVVFILQATSQNRMLI